MTLFEENSTKEEIKFMAVKNADTFQKMCI